MSNDKSNTFLPSNIIEGEAKYSQLSKDLPEGKVLIVCSDGALKRENSHNLLMCLKGRDVEYFSDVKPNPDIDYLESSIDKLKKINFKSVIGFGGGSALDTAKIFSVAMKSDLEKPLSCYFRDNKKIEWKRSLYFVAIPTTSGSGSEATQFATVWDFRNKKKFSLDGGFLLPDKILLDPQLTLTLPRDITLFPGLDATSHALESIWNKNADRASNEIAYEALSLISKSLPQVLKRPSDLEARSSMQIASLLAGISINRTRSAIAHSISYPLTSRYSVPHGIACSFTLPYLIDLVRSLNTKFFQKDNIISNIKNMLVNMDLKKEILRFADIEEIFNVTDEMYSPERAGNFYYKISENEIYKIIKHSL